MMYTFGTETRDTEVEIEQEIASFCAQELDNQHLSIVTDKDGNRYAIQITAKLVPVTPHPKRKPQP